MKFTDSHCHLDFDEFSDALPDLLHSCANRGIHRIIVPATEPDNWSKVINLCSQNTGEQNQRPQLLPCLGIHPWFLAGLTQAHLEQLSRLSQKHRKVLAAIGETGIDNVIAKAENNLKQQLSFFEFQLQLAKSCQLPVIVHHRHSHHHIIPMLKQNNSAYGGIIHAFSGSYQQAKTYIDLGFKLGVGGTITYDRAVKTINAIKQVPLSAIVLETDAPSMPLAGFQGQSNSPLRVVDVFERLALIRDEAADKVSEQIEINIQELFHL